MLWDLEHSSHLRFFEAIQKRGRKTPLDFYVIPNVFTVWLIEAFNFLSPSRGSGFEIGYIPITEMTSYSSVFPLLLTQREFCKAIRAMDLQYVRFLNESKPPPDKVDVKAEA